MEFKDYYKTLGVASDASAEVVQRAYRKLVRKFHPDVSKEADNEARFKEIGEAGEVLRDATKRAAYDEAAARHARQQRDRAAGGPGGFGPGAQRPGDFDFGGFGDGVSADGEHSAFFEAMFGRGARPASVRRRRMDAPGADHHAAVLIDLEDAYRSAQRSIELRSQEVEMAGAAAGPASTRTLDVNIPKGIRAGQRLRLVGQGGPGQGGEPAGDLYLEVGFKPHARFRVDGRDVSLDLPLAPWEAALGAQVSAPTPEGPVDLTVPAGSVIGSRLRLRGRGIPGTPPGDLYVLLTLALPPADTPAAQAAYRAFAAAFDFHPRDPA